MTKREITNECKKIFFDLIDYEPIKTQTMYKDISSFISKLSKEYGYEALFFCFQDIDKQLKGEYYLKKFLELNIYQKRAYVKVVVDSKIKDMVKYIEKKEMVNTEHSIYDSSYKITQNRNCDTMERTNITRFLEGDDFGI